MTNLGLRMMLSPDICLLFVLSTFIRIRHINLHHSFQFLLINPCKGAKINSLIPSFYQKCLTIDNQRTTLIFPQFSTHNPHSNNSTKSTANKENFHSTFQDNEAIFDLTNTKKKHTHTCMLFF